jgi:hypothetical protein
MHIEVQVEEPSAEEALRHLLPKIIGERATFGIINYGAKHNLLAKLPARLRAYAARIHSGEDLKLAVLIDCDGDDCRELKNRLEAMARDAGLATKSAPDGNNSFIVVNRLAIEELEAWFLGDAAAVRAAFPKASTFEKKPAYRDPDAIRGGTWEALHRLLKPYYPESYPKIEAARRIAPHLNVSTNRSASFRCFCSGLKSLVRSD